MISVWRVAQKPLEKSKCFWCKLICTDDFQFSKQELMLGSNYIFLTGIRWSIRISCCSSLWQKTLLKLLDY